MTSIMAGSPPATTQRPESDDRAEETRIARFLAQADPVDALAASGYLAGRDGNLVARELRAPQLRRALRLSICSAADVDVDDFYRGEAESEDDWRRRRTATTRANCARCPVRAACAELALRQEDAHGVRGGLTEDRLRVRLAAEHDRLLAARAEDTRIQRARSARIQAALDVQRLAAQYMGNSIPQTRREANNAAVKAAVRRRDELVAAHRGNTGWTQAA